MNSLNIPPMPEAAIDTLTDALGQIPAARALLRTVDSELARILTIVTELRAESRIVEWRSMDSAPTDGTPVLGLIGDDEVEVRWAEQRVCMLAGEVRGAGTFGPGWEDTANCLEVDAPEGWRPVEAGESR